MRAVAGTHQRGLESVAVLHEVVGELPLDTQGAEVGGAVHRRLHANQLVIFGQQVDRATHTAVRADRAGLDDLTREVDCSQGLAIGQRAGGAGLHALATERATRVAELVAKFSADCSVETAVQHCDCVVTLLLGANAHTPVTRYALIVVAQDEWVGVGLGLAPAGLLAFEAAGARLVTIDEFTEFLGCVAAQRIDG